MSAHRGLSSLYGHARVKLLSWQWEALRRAAARHEWTRESLRIRAADLEVLLAAAYVRRIGHTGEIELYEITDAGCAVLTHESRT